MYAGDILFYEPLNAPAVKADEWLPCPFCGGTDIRHDCHVKAGTGLHEGEDVYSMCCCRCGATFPNRYRLELLREAWNRRASPPAPMPAVDEAKDSLLKRLAEFVGLAFDASFDGCDLDGGTIQDFGVRCGLLVNVEFDPEKHDDGGIGLEPGDDFFEYAPDFRTALAPPSSAPASEGDKS